MEHVTSSATPCRSQSPDAYRCFKPRGHRKAVHAGKKDAASPVRHWHGQGTTKSPSFWENRDTGSESEADWILRHKHGI
jgi:hypothetical protein